MKITAHTMSNNFTPVSKYAYTLLNNISESALSVQVSRIQTLFRNESEVWKSK
jgi:hypothetical protein